MQDLFNDQFFTDVPLLTRAEVEARAAQNAHGDEVKSRTFCFGGQPVTKFDFGPPLNWDE